MGRIVSENLVLSVLIKINLWEKKENGLKMHERYIITDNAGIFVGAGTDKDDFQQSEWSLKDYTMLDEIRSQYIESADVFNLKCIITASRIDNRF